jgi:hypothetical protein
MRRWGDGTRVGGDCGCPDSSWTIGDLDLNESDLNGMKSFGHP